MKISNSTLGVLRNFSDINQNILFKMLKFKNLKYIRMNKHYKIIYIFVIKIQKI